ncbi:hypothetical protein Ahy_A07g034465 [Arachis hypogaea]|uniref:Uncharacterized protein n=1 Tax=Arachis hypogaea TaxID=3818 RepID=A0A445CBZ9_ARAHY|nr:hypothetical protein Ahy_A07g034465 [Arachis hypogaea]
MTDLKKEAPSFHLMRLNDEATCENETEVFNFGDVEPTDCFLTKFMEVHETVKEADITLHALTKALEDSKQLTATCKQVGESLMIERSSLAEKRFKNNSLMLHKEENQLLQDHIHISLLEMSNMVSMLKQCFLQFQTDVEKKLMIILTYPDQNAELRELLGELYAKKSEDEEQVDEHEEMIKGLEKELEMASSLADEKEAIAMEARQESESCKLYAKRKEEEVKNLEHSVEELEGTINVLEEKVSCICGSLIYGNSLLELDEALNRIKFLEKENAEQDKEIKKYQEYIFELVLHAEAQSIAVPTKGAHHNESRKFKLNINGINIRGNGEKLNKDKRLKLTIQMYFESCSSDASGERTRIISSKVSCAEELEPLAASRLKEDLIDQNQIVKWLEDAHHQREEYSAKEKENLNLRLNDLLEERESCISELKTKDEDVTAAQIAVQQLQERDQLLSAQNEMLKTDKTNLMRKIAELDDMLKKFIGKQITQHLSQLLRIQACFLNLQCLVQGKGALDSSNNGLNRRFSQAERLSRVNEELAWYCKSAGSDSHGYKPDFSCLKLQGLTSTVQMPVWFLN